MQDRRSGCKAPAPQMVDAADIGDMCAPAVGAGRQVREDPICRERGIAVLGFVKAVPLGLSPAGMYRSLPSGTS